MTSSFDIRKGNESDLDSILEIVKLAIPLMHESQNFQWDDEYPTREKFLDDISKGFLYVCILTTSDQPVKLVGFCAITTDQDPEYADCGWDITIMAIVPHRLCIHPHYRRQGIAELFMNKAEYISKYEYHYNLIRVDTNKVNQSAQKLFIKLGYVYCGEISLKCKAEGLRFCCYEKVLHDD